MHALGLDLRRAAPVMPFGTGLAFGEQLLLGLKHEVGVFAMGGDDHAEFFGEPHCVIKLFVGDAERAFVSEEDFETGDAALDDFGELSFAFLVEARDGLVEREIAGAVALSLIQPEFEAVGERLLVAGLADHLDDGGRAADQRGFTARSHVCLSRTCP